MDCMLAFNSSVEADTEFMLCRISSVDDTAAEMVFCMATALSRRALAVELVVVDDLSIRVELVRISPKATTRRSTIWCNAASNGFLAIRSVSKSRTKLPLAISWIRAMASLTSVDARGELAAAARDLPFGLGFIRLVT